MWSKNVPPHERWAHFWYTKLAFNAQRKKNYNLCVNVIWPWPHYEVDCFLILTIHSIFSIKYLAPLNCIIGPTEHALAFPDRETLLRNIVDTFEMDWLLRKDCELIKFHYCWFSNCFPLVLWSYQVRLESLDFLSRVPSIDTKIVS